MATTVAQRRKSHNHGPVAAGTLGRFLRNNGLSLTITLLFLVSLAAQIATGLDQHNEAQSDHGRPAIGLVEYFGTGHFLEATAENWESEFLQMFVYVLLTVFLFQRGSAESKKLDEAEAVDRDPRRAQAKPGTPWPVVRGGWVLRLYENSLSLAFLLLFLISFVLHAVGGMRLYNEDQLAHGGSPITFSQYLGTSQFWFESFQNWQSEFLSVASIIVLSIFLRQRGSPESKPVDAPHSQTGEE
jgi:hypothetical protein